MKQAPSRRAVRLGILLLAAAGAAAAGNEEAKPSAAWTVEVQRGQPLRIQRNFLERTPDASLRDMSQVQRQQGVNPWAQLLLIAGTQLVATLAERKNKVSEEEIVVSTDQAVGGAVALAQTATVKKYGTQDDANIALQPYAEALSGSSLFDLLAAAEPDMRQAGLHLSDGSKPASSAQPVIHVAPKMVFAADQRSLSADTLVGFGPLNPDAPVAGKGRALRVQVHSGANDSLDISDHWLKEGAKTLRSTFSSLVITAIDVARRRLGSPEAPPAGAQRTFRLRLAAENLYVRGTLVEAGCERVLIESMQGVLVSAPSAALRDRDLLPEPCAR